MKMPRWLRFVLAAVLAFGISTVAHASRTVTGVVFTYGSQTDVATITAPPNAVISADVTVAHPSGGGGGARWRATSYRIGAGAAVCVNHADFDAAGTNTVTFNMTAPAAVGTYNVVLIAYADNACTANPSPAFTRTNGVTVSNADNSTVTANPGSVTADGTSTSLITVTLIDSGGAPRVGKAVTLTAGSGSSIVSPPSGLSDAAGVVTFTVRDAVAETVIYTARNTTDGITITQTATVTFTPAPAVASFNVIEPVEPPAGRIYTKVAGDNFVLDIVALRADGTVNTAFVGTVAVDVVDATSTACSNPAIAGIQAFGDQTFVLSDNGRHSLTGTNTVTNVYRQAKIRVRYPVAAPTILACSSDVFAIRPASLVVTVTNGSGTPLTNTAIPGAVVHKAGVSFTVAAQARDSAGNVTNLYDGTPTSALAICAGGACTGTFGTLTLGAWSAGGGTVTATGSYDDVGAFTLQLTDTGFADADLPDGAASNRTFSGSLDVGRFIPDRFTVAAPSITPRADIAACAGSSFTYLGERMDVAFTLTAVNAAGAVTTRYTGALARLDLGNIASFGFGAIDPAGPALLTARIAAAGAQPPLSWAAGAANVTARILVNRNPGGTRDGPFNARIGVAPADPDGVTLDSAALDLDTDANASLDHLQVGTAILRFGRLRLQNGHGSALVSMPVRMETQYWNGTAFVKNADDRCTPIAAANVSLGNYQKNLGSGETVVSVSSPPIFNGDGWLRLSAPGSSNNGSVDVSVNLTGGAAGQSCTAGMPASTGSSMSYLQSAWCGATFTRDPTARATFGVYRNSNSIVYQRENF